jgi:hypothetical protein
MDKTVVGFDERELQQLNIILTDEDAEGALAFLRDVVMAKIKSIPKSTDCHPKYDD